MRSLELLAPARNMDIGIAAIDCGADAVYIAGPRGGARKDAGNPISDIETLCRYAHRYGVKIFVTFNITFRDDELEQIHRDMLECQRAGADAFIVRDLRLAGYKDITVPLHASTQCAIRTPERAMLFERAGCSRVTLERELSIARIRRICNAVSCEVECFVHGALCVCYSGQCLLSEHITSHSSEPVRSADRGECIQACRSLYDLEDENGKVLLRNKPLLSLKDFNLYSRLSELAEAGVYSFKIEGRLKSVSYVRNVVRAYSKRLDEIVAASGGKFRRASFGRPEGGFVPDLKKSFNRGYTELFFDGRRSGEWASMNSPKWAGEPVGKVISVKPCPQGIRIGIAPASGAPALSNGDGFSFVGSAGVQGFRGDVCSPGFIITRSVRGLNPGMTVYRNLSASFEKELESNPCRRVMTVGISVEAAEDLTLKLKARSEDGREVETVIPASEPANDPVRAESLVRAQLSKHSGIYSFEVESFTHHGPLPFLKASELNAARRVLADMLDASQCHDIPLVNRRTDSGPIHVSEEDMSESVARAALTESGERELMRMKYCLRSELGICPRRDGGQKTSSEAPALYIVNGAQRYRLRFDCGHCEMTVLASKD